MGLLRTCYRLCLGLAFLQCGAPVREESPAAPQDLPADRELWDARLELNEPSLGVDIQARYVREQGRYTHADSGVQVRFSNAAGTTYSTMEAARLTLDQQRGKISTAGDVRIRASEGVEIRSDSLHWERQEDALRIPGSLRIRTETGWTEGRNLETQASFETWTMGQVEGLWRGRDDQGAYEVEIRALREESQRLAEGFSVRYDSAVVGHRGRRIEGAEALYRQAEGFIYFSGGVVSRDSTRRLRASEMDYDCRTGRAVLRGGVELVQENWRLEADTATLEPDLMRARGQPALFVWLDRSIEARELTYDEGTASLQAVGQVAFRRGAQRLQARELVYYEELERLEATHGVVLEEPRLRGQVRGGRLEYDLQAGRAVLRGDPQLQGVEAATALSIGAEIMRFDLEAGRMTGLGAFAVDSGPLQLRAQRGHYDAEAGELQLAQAVRLAQEGSSGGVAGQLQADSVVVQFEEGQVTALRAPGPLRGRWGAVETGEDWIESSGAELVFGAQGLERLNLIGDAVVTHRYEAGGEVSRFQGERMSLWLGRQGLEKVSIEGAAELVARLVPEKEADPAAVNRVAGERLELEFAEGALVQARVVGSIQGQYYPPAERGP